MPQGRGSPAMAPVMTDDGPALETAGLSYWVLRYSRADFYDGRSFRDYAPALYLGISGRVAHPGHSFDRILPGLQARYPRIRGLSSLEWPDAIPVALAAWERA